MEIMQRLRSLETQNTELLRRLQGVDQSFLAIDARIVPAADSVGQLQHDVLQCTQRLDGLISHLNSFEVAWRPAHSPSDDIVRDSQVSHAHESQPME